jgi:hypothetical protein
MPDENPTRVDAGDYAPSAWIAERAIVLQLLRDDHDPRWTRAELRRETSDIPRWAMRKAFDRLEAEGVLVTKAKHVLASRCAQRLDDLDLIAV